MKKAIGWALAALLVGGCATKQNIRVNTVPDGAHVMIIRMGEKRKTQSVAGVNAADEVTQYEDKPIDLGNAPIDYTFEPYHEGWVRAGLYKFKESKHCLRAKLLADKDGMTAEKIVSFDADHDPVQVDITLEQLAKEKK